MKDNTHCPYCGKPIKASDTGLTRYGEFGYLWHIDCLRRVESPHPWELWNAAISDFIEAWKQGPPYTWVERFVEWLARRLA